MKRTYTILAATIALFWIVAATSGSEEGAQPADSEHTGPALVQEHQFVGVAKCKTCHRKEASGQQYQTWQASKHAKAFETLGTDKAKEVAASKGIDDPQTSGECLRCHVTGYGVAAELLGPKYSAEDGVTCESCHGPGGDYYKKKTMKGVMSGEIEAVSVGLEVPTEETCLECHNDKSPTFEGFDFDEYAEKIAHPIPAETKAQYE